MIKPGRLVVRYRFSEFTLSPQRRVLVRAGREVPLIPRYFDLLQLLIERRSEAVHRRDIFERVWADVTVSESALSQAVRTVRRALDDDSREPRFIRTVSRHGYRFVFPDVVEEQDEDTTWLTPAPAPPATVTGVDTPRWGAAAMGAGLAGIVAGGVGGLMLAAAPESSAPIALAPVLAGIGGGCGALGGAGVGAGLSLADKWERAPRALALTAGGALGGGLVGVMVQWLARWGLAALVGLDLGIGGGLVGVAIGAAAGLGVAIGSEKRLPVMALIVGTCCGVAGLLLTLAGHPLAGGTIHAIADAAEGSRATLAPLGRLIGEPDFGPVTSAILAFGEAATFGIGVAWGLGRRRRHPSEPVSRS